MPLPGGGCVGFLVLDTFPLDAPSPPTEKAVFAWAVAEMQGLV